MGAREEGCLSGKTNRGRLGIYMFYSWKLHEIIYIFATFELKLRAGLFL